MSTPLFRTIGSVVALSACYWGLYLRPRRVPLAAGGAAGDLSTDAANRAQARLQELQRAGRPEEARPLALALVQNFPGNPVYLRRLAEVEGALGHDAAAAEAWERFLTVSPTPSEAFPDLGRAYQRLKRPELAVRAFERGVALSPGDPELLCYLGQAYERTGATGKALDAYRRACAASPGYTDGTIGWARVEVFQDRPEEALRRLEPVLARPTANADALLVQGLALRKLGRLAEARAALEQGCRLSPGDPDFPLFLARIAEAEGRRPEALAWYDRYLALRDDPAARARRNQLAGQGRR